MPLGRFGLSVLLLGNRIKGIEARRPNVLALPGFASRSLATVYWRVGEERLLFEEIEETMIVHTHFILFIDEPYNTSRLYTTPPLHIPFQQ